MVFSRRFYVLFFFVATFCVGVQAQEICTFEAKLLLVPTQVGTAVSLLQARRELRSRIYFYDTPALDLLSKGLILRLRQSTKSDLTVKLRPLTGKQFSDPLSPSSVSPSRGSERYKCEVEITGGVEGRSYSVGTTYGGHVPETGEGLVRMLSPGQRRLLEDSQIQIDWTKVKRVADIRSTSWTVRGEAALDKMSMEFWEWPGGRILEVSTKAGPDAGGAAYTELESLAKEKGLVLSAAQQSKTATALEGMKAVASQSR
jgi:hypothetical protein